MRSMDLETWWPLLRQDSRDWLTAHNGEPLSRSVAEDITRVAGPFRPGAWWVGEEGPDGLHLSDPAVDWIEGVANGELPGPPVGAR